MVKVTQLIICFACLFWSFDSAFGQQYFGANEGKAIMYFIINDNAMLAKSDEVRILYEPLTGDISVAVNIKSFSTSEEHLTETYFENNSREIFITGKASFRAYKTAGKSSKFFLMGMLISDDEAGPVSASGEINWEHASRYNFLMSTGIETKWLGNAFSEASNFPVVNIFIPDVKLIPIIGE